MVSSGIFSVLTPIKAIRAKCLECCCGSAKEVRNCPVISCDLYPYRMGHRPQKDLPEKDKPEQDTENEQMTVFP